MPKYDLTGKQFSRLTVVCENGKNNRNEILWKCKCSCGNTTNVTTYRLRKGLTKSCGCYSSDVHRELMKDLGNKKTTHGMSKTRIYKIYRNIKERCTVPTSKKYKDYGGRGINLCKEWETFEAFYEWSIKNGYKENLTIDRIDNDGNYEPDNCRWADMNTQNNNRRCNRLIEFRGEEKTLSQWAKEYNIDKKTLRARLDIYGYSIEDALQLTTKEVREMGKGRRVKLINTETKEEQKFYSIKKASEFLGLDYKEVQRDFKKGLIFLDKYKLEDC